MRQRTIAKSFLVVIAVFEERREQDEVDINMGISVTNSTFREHCVTNRSPITDDVGDGISLRTRQASQNATHGSVSDRADSTFIRNVVSAKGFAELTEELHVCVCSGI